MWRTPPEKVLERWLSGRKRRQVVAGRAKREQMERAAWSFRGSRRRPPWMNQRREPYRWDETGPTRSIFGELVEDALAAGATVWRRSRR